MEIENKIMDNNTMNKLTDLFKTYGIEEKWIYYQLNEKGEKINPCGINHNWSKNECFNKSISAKENDGITRYPVRRFDITNTNLAIFDDDKKNRTYEETILEYPFLKDCYYTKGNTKGFHFIIQNDEFNSAKKVTDTINNRDLITDFIWCGDNKLYGNSILNIDMDTVKKYFPTFNTSKDVIEKVIIEKTNNDMVEEIKKYDNKFIQELLDNISVQYCDDFKSWFDIVGSLKSINEKGFIDYFSKKSSKYKKGSYDKIVSCITGEKHSVGTIYHYSRESNSKNHFYILNKYGKIPVKPYDELGDCDFSEIFINLTDELFYHTTDECYYGYNSSKKIWDIKTKEYCLSMTTRKLLDYLNKELKGIYLKMSNLELCSSIEKNCSCSSCQKKTTLENQQKQLGKNIKYVKSATNTKHILDYVFDTLKNDGKDITMDSNPYLFCWDNKTYDIKNKKFIERNKYDYITNTTGYDYEEPIIDYTNEIDSLLRNIFSDKEVAKCYFSVCKSGLTGVLEEKFTLANGSGGNGKGLINFCMKELLGNYFHDISHSIVTKEITDDKPLPAISQLDGKRFCAISEIKEDSILLEDSIKKLTNPVINARGMRSSKTRVKNTATFVAECNARPKIQGDNGDAIGRRFIDVFFNKRYTDDEDKLKKDGYLKANPMYKTKEWIQPRRIAFFHWLLQFNDTIYEPMVVKCRSKEFLKECNIPLIIFENSIVKCEFDKTKDTLITACDFLEIIRKSEEYKILEKTEKKLYTKNKVVDFLRGYDYDNYMEKKDIYNPKRATARNCLIGYKLINDNSDDDEE